ncbi:MAG TPA: LysR family transcriptional regulator [Alphaproteobacteria bacterium]
MELSEMEDFLALAKTGSFRRAADLRNVTQPAFSRRVMALEDRMGLSLFDRSVTPVMLTPAGDRFYAHAETMSRGMSKAWEDARSALSALDNPIRLVVSHTLAISFFPMWWKDCTRALPDLGVHLTGQRIEQCVTDLREGLADFAVIHAATNMLPFTDSSGLKVLRLGSDKIVPVMAKRLLGQSVGLLSYAPGSFLARLAEVIITDIPSHRRRMDVVFESPSAEVLKAMTLAGFGMAFLPYSLIEDDLQQEFLVPALPKKHSLDLDILLLRPTRELSPAGEALWDYLDR